MNRRVSTFHRDIFARLARTAVSLLVAFTYTGLAPAAQTAQAQTPRIVASESGDWFWTTEFLGGAELNIAIYESQDTSLPPLWQGSRTADEWGFIIAGYDGTGVDLQPGNYLVISDGATTKELLLETITMEVFDNFQEVMAGAAPPGRVVLAAAGTQFEHATLEVEADPLTGAWMADFTTLSFNITEEMRPWSFAHIYDEDMDANEANPPWLPGVWRDEFESEWPGEPWYWINDNPAAWSMAENPGFLRIYTSPYGTGGENLLLRSPDLDYFVIQTRLLFEPVSNFQFAGLVLWQDASNFLQLGRAYCDILDFCADNAIYFDHVVDSSVVNSNFATPVGSPNEAYLRLERRGSEISAFFSAEGIYWSYIGTHFLPEGFSLNGVGLTSSQNFFGEPAVPADFDYFALAPLAEGGPVIRVGPQDDHLRVDDFTPNSHVNFRVYEYPGAPEPFLDIGAGSDASGYTNILGWQHGGDLLPGNYVIASDGLITKELVLEHVSLDAFDAEANLLTGTAPLGRTVWVWVSWPEYDCGMFVTADQITADPAIGAWTADFGAQGCDLFDEMAGIAQVMDDDWDQTESERPRPPTGYHDYNGGDVPSWDWSCSAGGWAMDPDAPFSDVYVRILVDGAQLFDPLLAENYREDLEIAWNEGSGGCPGGSCAFETSLLGYVSLYQPHEIMVEAQDVQTGEWHPLFATPKTIICRTYDIYAFDTLTGKTIPVTGIQDAHEFNPKWSPDGKKVIHTAWWPDTGANGVYITDFSTGVSTALAGADQGGNPEWSPNGRWIAFNIGPYEDADLYILPPSGGAPRLLAEDAMMPTWAPNSQRLAYVQSSDSSIRTVALAGGRQTLVVESGVFPAWSPNGRWIAYTFDGDLWKVPVDVNGNRTGDPIQLTSHETWEGRVTWSADSRTLAFHAGYDGDTDIWSIPANGGEPTRLTGGADFDDYDPSFSPNGRYIAYASYTPLPEPLPQSARLWVAAFTYDLPAGFWSEGVHPYHFEFDLTLPEPVSFSGQGGELFVSNDAPLYDGSVLLRGPRELHRDVVPGGPTCEDTDAIHPDQPARFLIGWLLPEMTHTEARLAFDSMTARAVWDDGMSAGLVRHEIRPYSEETWFDYVCQYTVGR